MKLIELPRTYLAIIFQWCWNWNPGLSDLKILTYCVRGNQGLERLNNLPKDASVMEKLKFRSGFVCPHHSLSLWFLWSSLEKKASMKIPQNSGKHMPFFYMEKYTSFRESILHLAFPSTTDGHRIWLWIFQHLAQNLSYKDSLWETWKN